MPDTRATLRYSGTSPYKVRAVLGLIRGVEVAVARQRLQFCGRDAADEVIKVLDSAVANAEENDHLPADELFVSRAWADEGPTMKRWRPRARGRGTRIRKRTCHLTVVVSRYSDEELARRARSEEASGRVPDRRRRVQRRRRAAEAPATTEETPVEDTAAAEAAALAAADATATDETFTEEAGAEEAGAEEAGAEEVGTEDSGADAAAEAEAIGSAETEAGAPKPTKEDEA
jgi:large subunit ribosomal protein L22